MGRKIFISYKYGDTNVQQLDNIIGTRVRDYVDKLQTLIDEHDHINKGELDGQSLADFEDDRIASHLRDKIYDSSITIVLVSKNMKNPFTPERDQWIPWEISYSLKEHSRDGRVSLSNAILAVVIPDEYGSYDFFISDNTCQYCHCRTLHTNFLFGILRENMFNIKTPTYTDCNNHLYVKPMVGHGSYVYSVKWTDFIGAINLNLDIVTGINGNIDAYNIVKVVN